MIQEQLHSSNHSRHGVLLDDILDHVINAESRDIHELYGDNVTTCKKWDFENSLFFSFTVVTTIGKSRISLIHIEKKMLRLWFCCRVWTSVNNNSRGKNCLSRVRHHWYSPQRHPHRISRISVQ